MNTLIDIRAVMRRASVLACFNRTRGRQAGSWRRHVLAELLAWALAFGSGASSAGSPSSVVIGACVDRVVQYFGVTPDGFDVRKAVMHRLASGAQVLVLDLRMRHGINPRFYCTIGVDGRISRMQTLPRLPAEPQAMVAVR